MALDSKGQFTEAAKRGQRILVALPHAAGVDETGAGLALASLMTRLGKSVDIVSDRFAMRPEHKVLPGVGAVKAELGSLQHFVISVPVGSVQVGDFLYSMDDDTLKITLTPKSGNWNPSEVKAEAGKYRYDLAITVGAADLDALGDSYRTRTDFWHTVPILNIDRSPANERYGAVNLVDISAASVSEVAYDLVSGCDQGALDKTTSTALLAGLIHKTRNFRTDAVTPKTLTVAADLVSRGAERERIVGELYRTRSVETLRLWGRALARLKADSANRLIWTMLSKQDFLAAGAGEEELLGVMDELIAASPDASASFVLFESKEGAVKGIVNAGRTGDLLALTKGWMPIGTSEQVVVTMPGLGLMDAERALLERLRGARR